MSTLPLAAPTFISRSTPPPSSPLQLKKLYADSREDMEASRFVPATAFNCESREPEKWSFYLRRMLGWAPPRGASQRRDQLPLL